MLRKLYVWKGKQGESSDYLACAIGLNEAIDQIVDHEHPWGSPMHPGHKYVGDRRAGLKLFLTQQILEGALTVYDLESNFVVRL